MARDGDEDDYLPDICFPQTPPIYLGDEYEEFENEQGHTVYPVSEAPQHSEGQDPVSVVYSKSIVNAFLNYYKAGAPRRTNRHHWPLHSSTSCQRSEICIQST